MPDSLDSPILAIDVGGTFTDAVSWDGVTLRTGKVSSTPDDQGIGVTEAATRLAPDAGLLLHGTTVATNALLQRSGARTALITTEGFEDVIEIARQDRPSLYDSFDDRPTPLVRPDHRYGVSRHDPSAPEIDNDIEAVAISLLYGYREPEAEAAIADHIAMRKPGVVVARSSEVAPEFREYERTSTTVLNAYLQPQFEGYLERIGSRLAEAGISARLAVMRSSGGLMSAPAAARLPAAILLSGPAGGVVAAAALGRTLGHGSVISFDMGGTSTDVCRIEDGRPNVAYERAVDGYPCRMPSVAIHTVGAGGGSIAWLDAGGSLRVGPHSAGAMPGPAAYGRGGTQPTVTDANVVLGRIGETLADGLELDRGAAIAALSTLARPFDGDIERTALGIIEVVEEVMAGAIRKVTIEEGADPRDSVLVSFGGAGGLHAGALARRIGMSGAIVPPHAGVLSALGLLMSPPRVDRALSVMVTEANGVDLTTLAAGVAGGAGAELELMTGSKASVSAAADIRYVGQAHELTVPVGGDWDRLVVDFTALHLRRNGFTRPGDPVEVVTLRGQAVGVAPLSWADLPRHTPGPGESRPATMLPIGVEVRSRQGLAIGEVLDGPAVVVDDGSTTYVSAGERATMTDQGALELTW